MSRNDRLICIQESLTSAKSKKFITGEVQIWFVKAKKNSSCPGNDKILSNLYSLHAGLLCMTSLSSAWVKIQNFPNPELYKFKFLHLLDARKNE